MIRQFIRSGSVNSHRLRMYRKKVLNISDCNLHRNQTVYNPLTLPI